MVGAAVKRFAITLLAVIGLSVGFSQVASAADLPVKAPRAPVVAPAIAWDGFYIGAQAGVAWGSLNAVAFGDCTATGYYCHSTDPATFPNLAPVLQNASAAANKSSLTGGIELGRNWQSGGLVYGIEMDVSALRLAASNRASAGYASSPGVIYTVASSRSADWFLTARTRLGWTVSNFLFYGTGGLAVTTLNISNSFSDTNTPANGVGASSHSAVKPGWVIGGGVEAALNAKWTVKAEYLYADFGSTATTATVFGNVPGASSQLGVSTQLKANIVRVGLNFKL
jgi:outer membrane immunogenic protein